MTTTSEFIRNAYFLANVLDPDDEVDAYYDQTGLDIFNEILAHWSSLGLYIPRFTQITINAVKGTYQYEVSPQILDVYEANIVDTQGNKYILTSADEKLNNSFNYTLVSARPSFIYVRPNDALVSLTTGLPSTDILLYPTPDNTYTVTLLSKQQLGSLTLEQNINTVPTYALRALRYQLARDLSEVYSTVLSPRFEIEYMRIMREFKAANKQDMTVKTDNPFIGYRRVRPWGTYVG